MFPSERETNRFSFAAGAAVVTCFSLFFRRPYSRRTTAAGSIKMPPHGLLMIVQVVMPPIKETPRTSEEIDRGRQPQQ